MNALTLAVVAAMAVGSDRPEPISSETEEALNLGRGWEGIYRVYEDSGVIDYTTYLKPKLWQIIIQLSRLSCVEEEYLDFLDEGRGRCRSPQGRMCIYRREAGQLFICIGDWEHRPTSFCCDKYQSLLILKPAKPAKK